MYHDLVVRNPRTTEDRGSTYFSKGGFGFLNDLSTSYGAVALLEADGILAPKAHPRWWQFSGTTVPPALRRPINDDACFDRLALPYPNPANYLDCN